MKTYPLVPIATGWRLQALPKELVDRSNKCIDFSQQRKKSLTSTLELEQQSTGKEPWPSWSQTCLPGCFDSLYMLSASCRSSEPESPWNYTLHTAANKPYKWPGLGHLWSLMIKTFGKKPATTHWQWHLLTVLSWHDKDHRRLVSTSTCSASIMIRPRSQAF